MGLKKEQDKYSLIYKTEMKEWSKYFISEEGYFEYYQNMDDPTFENYNFEIRFEECFTNEISYVDTISKMLEQGKRLSILTWQGL